MESTRKASNTRARRKRVPFGVMRQKLSVDQKTLDDLKKKGKVPRWINDTGNRLMEAQESGYEFVENREKAIVTGTEEEEHDKRIRYQVGKDSNGLPTFAYLMAIKKQFYDEDQAEKERINAMVDQSIKAGSPGGVGPNDIGINPDKGNVNVKSARIDTSVGTYKP
jgi:hypothetical protein